VPDSSEDAQKINNILLVLSLYVFDFKHIMDSILMLEQTEPAATGQGSRNIQNILRLSDCRSKNSFIPG